MVARDRIELPTRGFSVRVNLHPGTPTVTQISHLGEIVPPVGDGRCSWVTLDWVPKWKPATVRIRGQNRTVVPSLPASRLRLPTRAPSSGAQRTSPGLRSTAAAPRGCFLHSDQHRERGGVQ